MVTHFTMDDWRMTVNTPDGQKRGLEIIFNDGPVPDDLIIQLYQTHGNEYQLIMFRLDLGISVKNNSIIIFGGQPFDGKVVIK